jgi:hypothetical protein
MQHEGIGLRRFLARASLPQRVVSSNGLVDELLPLVGPGSVDRLRAGDRAARRADLAARLLIGVRR